MNQFVVINEEGKEVSKLPVPESLEKGPVRKGLLYQIVHWQQAKKRRGTHATKTRGQVSGSTKKIYRQKGTGRARHGARTAPIFVGGGKAFGPHPRSYSYKISRKAKKRGLQSALVYQQREGKFSILEDISWEKISTKQAAAFFERLKLKSALIVLEAPNVVVEKSVRNLPNFKVLPVAGLNVFDVLRYENTLVLKGALEKIDQRLSL